ncbi:MAG: DUF1488 domain-containing protein [Candidatus Thiodiazotropha sp. 6PLUC2]
MSVKFPNPSRSFEEDGNRVCFWGYDNVIEIAFYVEEDALKKLCPGLSDTEAGFLKAFDSVRNKIYDVADKVYTRGHERTFSHILSAKDF